MRVYLKEPKRVIAACKVSESGEFVTVGKGHKCECGSCEVRGTGIKRRDYDTYYADAICRGCGRPRGEMRTVMDTLFGIEEDERVLNSRCRVY